MTQRWRQTYSEHKLQLSLNLNQIQNLSLQHERQRNTVNVNHNLSIPELNPRSWLRMLLEVIR